MLSFFIALVLGTGAFAETPKSHKPCEFLLEISDRDVHPPFAHGFKMIDLLNSDPSHKVISRDGAKFYGQTTDLENLMYLLGGHHVSLKRVEIDGVSVHVYNNDSKISDVHPSYHDLYKALGYLREGVYWLIEDSTGEKATMVIVHSQRVPDFDYQPSITLNIDLWPGHHMAPQREEFFGARRLASFTNGAAADGHRVSFHGHDLTVRYSLPYGHGSDVLKFKIGSGSPIKTVTTFNGKTYVPELFFPLKLRAE